MLTQQSWRTAGVVTASSPWLIYPCSLPSQACGSVRRHLYFRDLVEKAISLALEGIKAQHSSTSNNSTAMLEDNHGGRPLSSPLDVAASGLSHLQRISMRKGQAVVEFLYGMITSSSILSSELRLLGDGEAVMLSNARFTNGKVYVVRRPQVAGANHLREDADCITIRFFDTRRVCRWLS